MSDANPIKNVTARYIRAYERSTAVAPRLWCQYYDSGILLQYAIPDALKKGAPGTEAFRTALRDSLEAQRKSSAARASSTLRPPITMAWTKRARDLITIKDGKFRLLGENKGRTLEVCRTLGRAAVSAPGNAHRVRRFVSMEHA